MQRYDEIQKRPNQQALLQQLGGADAGGFQVEPIGDRVRPGAVPGFAPGAPAPGARMPEAPPIEPPQASKPKPPVGDMQSVIMQSLAQFAPTVRGITGQDDSARKQAIEQHLRGLISEHGFAVNDVRGEKINVGGQWIDTMQDIANGQGGGAAIPQWLVEDGSGGGGGGMATPGMPGMHPLLGGDALAGIQAAIGQYAEPSSNLQALLQQLQGGR